MFWDGITNIRVLAAFLLLNKQVNKSRLKEGVIWLMVPEGWSPLQWGKHGNGMESLVVGAGNRQITFSSADRKEENKQRAGQGSTPQSPPQWLTSPARLLAPKDSITSPNGASDWGLHVQKIWAYRRNFSLKPPSISLNYLDNTTTGCR